MTLKRSLLQIFILAVACVFALSVNYLYAAVWQGPPSGTPPANNVDSPINVGTTNQVKDANLSVGHSANTASDYGLISYGRLRTTIGGVEFPDGTLQTTAATGGGGVGLMPTATGYVAGGSTSINLGSSWDVINFAGQNGPGEGDKGTAGGFVAKIGGVLHAELFTHNTNHLTFTLSTSDQCAGTGNVRLCARLDTSGNLLVTTGSAIQVSYIIYTAGGTVTPPSAVRGAGAILGGATATLAPDFNVVMIEGAYSDSDSGPISGFVTNQSGVWKGFAVVAGSRMNGVTLTTTESCTNTTNTLNNLCYRKDASGNLIIRPGSSVSAPAIHYVAF